MYRLLPARRNRPYSVKALSGFLIGWRARLSSMIGSGESRVYLYEVTTGAALVKRKKGDCPCDVEPLKDVLRSADAMWKVECYGLDPNNEPNLVYIRNDWHPQRALNDGGNLVNCSMRSSKDEELWHLEHSTTGSKCFAIRNKRSEKYLSIEVSNGHHKIAFQENPSYWFASIAKYVPSPSQIVTICAVLPLTAAAAAVAGIGAGTAIAQVAGWGTSVIVPATATTALAAIVKIVHDVAVDPASKEWVVMKM